MVKGKLLVGPILGIIGSALLLIAGFLAFGLQASLEVILAGAGLTWADVGFDPMILTIRAILTLVFAILGIIGAILGFTGKRVPGGALMLVGGLIAIIGLFIPLGVITVGFVGIPVPLTYSFLWVDPFLMLVGGILGIALKE